jgi:hypothetical protein
MTLIRWSLLALLAGSVACGGTDVNRGAPGDGDGDGDDEVDTDQDGIADADDDDDDNDGTPDDEDDDDDGDGIDDDDEGGGGDGDGDGDSNGCEEFSVFAMPTTPDMLIVLDRSGSMAENNRWNVSQAAVTSLTAQLNDVIHFGLMSFPKAPDFGSNPGGGDPLACFEACIGGLDTPECMECLGDVGGGLDLACEPGDIAVPVGADTAGAIASEIDALNAAGPSGGTPTSGTLQEAAKHIGSSVAGPDEMATPKYVLLVTDGEPTCPNGEGSRDATAEELALDRQLTVDAIKALRDAGVFTYVIGYDVTQFADAMNQFAQTGGTMNYRPVEDEESLVTEFKKIAGEVVSCTFVLETEPEDPRKVKITVDGTQVNYDSQNTGNGWSISGKTVTLLGSTCEGLQDGGEHQVDVQVTCEVVPVL